MEKAPPFSFTKGCPLMRIEAARWAARADLTTMLFDLEANPGQEKPIADARVIRHLRERAGVGTAASAAAGAAVVRRFVRVVHAG